MKSLTILVALFFCATASAQPSRRPGCESYQPGSDEVAKVVGASSEIPDSAELYHACVLRKLVQLRPGKLASNDTVHLWLIWDASERYRDIRILRQADCALEYTGSTDCTFLRLAARQGEGPLIELEGGIDSAREVFDLLAFRDRRLGTDFQPVSIRREGGMDFVLGVHGDGRKIAYALAPTCQSASSCTWNVLRQDRWQY